MTKKLAITVSGAVSLGSFEAGVMYEVIYAIGVHNLAAKNDDDKIIIDVITGASAGGMTATILAHKLLFDSDALADPYANDLYCAWVQDVDISNLLATHPGDADTKSILSSGAVDAISKKYLSAPYDDGATRPVMRHAAVGDQIHFGLSLSNLNGVDYKIDTKPKGKFFYTRFQDQLTTVIDGAEDNNRAYWEPLRVAATACGAFPFAFRPVELTRLTADYANDDLDPTLPSPTVDFCYTDGGVFQNEPLGMAKNLVDKIDPTHVGANDRYYLFVSPDAKKAKSSEKLNAGNADFVPFALQLAGAIFNQARFQDWIMADKINKQVDLLDQRAAALAGMLMPDTPEKQQVAMALQAATQPLLEACFQGPNRLSEIQAAKERLRIQYANLCALLSPQDFDVLLDAIVVLEAAASLAERDNMNIIGITAETSELAGSDLFAFCGFFNVKYRDHDYDVGRKKAQEFLTSDNSPLGKINYTPKEPIRIIDSTLDGLTLAKMDLAVRKEVLERLKNRVSLILKFEKENFLVRFALQCWIGKKIEGLLHI